MDIHAFTPQKQLADAENMRKRPVFCYGGLLFRGWVFSISAASHTFSVKSGDFEVFETYHPTPSPLTHPYTTIYHPPNHSPPLHISLFILISSLTCPILPHIVLHLQFLGTGVAGNFTASSQFRAFLRN